MTDCIDWRLPSRIAAGFKGGPEWQTRVTPLRNGREVRNREWLYPRYRYSANFGAFNAQDRQALIGAFMATGGKHLLFRFRDPTDFIVAAEPLLPVVGTSTPVQLSRRYSFGPSYATSLLQAPVAGTTVVRRDGVPIAVTVDALTGLVTPSAPWASGAYTFDTQYDRWVRFDSDWGAFTAATPGVWTSDIDLVEVPR